MFLIHVIELYFHGIRRNFLTSHLHMEIDIELAYLLPTVRKRIPQHFMSQNDKM